MKIVADCHVHSLHSGDSSTSMKEMILQGIQKELKIICFTEHNDFIFPITQLDTEGKFECDVNKYLKLPTSQTGKNPLIFWVWM